MPKTSHRRCLQSIALGVLGLLGACANSGDSSPSDGGTGSAAGDDCIPYEVEPGNTV
jgi:hypothetical protein